MDAYPRGFEENEDRRSAFIRELTLRMAGQPASQGVAGALVPTALPLTLVRYWHDANDLPDDVSECLASWDRLGDEEGFEIHTFHDASAAAYIAGRYGDRARQAFARCRHPAMRSDYLRMCFLLDRGGLYVDADDILRGDGWKELFVDDRLKVQPLCYDVPTASMVPASEIWRADLPTDRRIFYVNNDPIAAPAGHPVLSKALARATDRLLGDGPPPEIQETTGPGNLTAALAAHARDMMLEGAAPDFELLRDWEAIAETRWHLSYREDDRNWRNMAR